MGLKELLQKLGEDKDFEARFKNLGSIEAVLELAEKEGYTVTEEDIKTLRSEVEYQETGRAELPDDALEEVTGGLVILPYSIPHSIVKWFSSLFRSGSGNNVTNL